jgi:hypothetical protein
MITRDKLEQRYINCSQRWKHTEEGDLDMDMDLAGDIY